MKRNLFLFKEINTILFLVLISFNLCIAQTDPVAQTLPYSQNFTSLLATSSTYPAGWIGWNLFATGPTTSFPLIAPPAASDLNLNASSTASSATLGVHNYNGKIGILPGTTANPTLVLAINTTGKANVLVGFDIMTIRNPFDATNTRINQVDLQYRVGNTGNFASVTNISAGIYQNNTTNQTTAVTTPQNSQVKSFTLPAPCNNQAVVQLRWVVKDLSGVNNRSSFAIDNVSICPTTTTPTITIVGPSGSCVGNNAVYSAAITNGGTIPFYQWKKNGVNIGTNSPIFTTSGLGIGDQIQCILTSNASCVTSNIVSSNSIAIATLSNAPAISLQSLNNVSCPNAKNGAINISVVGGTPPYTIAWDTTNIQNGAVFGVTFGIKTNLHPLFGQGNPNGYIIDGVEAKQLNLTRGISYSFNVLAPTHPFFISTDLTGGNANFIVSSGQTGAPTQNGIVTFTPNNSHPPLLYYPCQFHQFMGYRININNGYLTEDLTNLNAGIYNVVVTDANGCKANAQYQITELPSPINLSANITNAACGAPSGSIALNITGGVAPYTVLWDTLNTSNGTQFNVMVGTKSPSHPYFGLGNPNGYLIDGIEANDLTLARGINYDFSILSPSHPWHISTNLIGGSSSNIVSSGQSTAPNDNGVVSFKPNNSHDSKLYYVCANHIYMGYQINIVDAYSTNNLSNLYPGVYTVSVVDANGCIGQASYTVAEQLSQIVISQNTITSTSCATASDGSIDISVSGGTPPYSIIWDIDNTLNGPTFGITTGSKTASNPYFGLGYPECYFVNGEEAKQLSLTRGIDYTFNILTLGHPWHISTDIIGGNSSNIVLDGQIGAPNDNGVVVFKPNSNHPNTLSYICAAHEYMSANINIIDGVSSEDLSGIPAGFYSVIVTDSIGCTASAVFNVLAGTSPCQLNLNLKSFLQGLYQSGGSIVPRLFNLGLSAEPTACDSIVVELRSSIDFSLIASSIAILHVDGTSVISFPPTVLGNSYYILVRHSNAIETWSKNAIPFLASPVVFDFTAP